MDRIYNYINQPLNTEDPLQNLVSGVAEFIPGISTELAKRRGDKFGEALSYLDYLGGGGAKVRVRGAEHPLLQRREQDPDQEGGSGGGGKESNYRPQCHRLDKDRGASVAGQAGTVLGAAPASPRGGRTAFWAASG